MRLEKFNHNGKELVRVNKQKANRLFNEGKGIYILPCKALYCLPYSRCNSEAGRLNCNRPVPQFFSNDGQYSTTVLHWLYEYV